LDLFYAAVTPWKSVNSWHFPRSGLQRERIEVGVAVVVVLVLGALEPPHHRVGDRREHHLDRYLGDELDEHDLRQPVVGNKAASTERERVEEQRVDSLAEYRGAYGPRPQPPALGEDLHFREHERVDELAAQERDQRSPRDAPRRAERDLIGCLVLPE